MVCRPLGVTKIFLGEAALIIMLRYHLLFFFFTVCTFALMVQKQLVGKISRRLQMIDCELYAGPMLGILANVVLLNSHRNPMQQDNYIHFANEMLEVQGS